MAIGLYSPEHCSLSVEGQSPTFVARCLIEKVTEKVGYGAVFNVCPEDLIYLYDIYI